MLDQLREFFGDVLGYTQGVEFQFVALQALAGGHPAGAAADLDLEVAKAVPLAAGDFGAKDIFDPFLVLDAQVVDVDRAVVELDLALAAGAEQAVERQIHHPRD